jgi:hypothetical protein
MELFISWSGNRSKHIATALHRWLPQIHDRIKPWLSSRDIGPGVRFSPEISASLERCQFGIVCLTLENKSKEWINFEAGAISKLQSSSRLFTYLFELDNADVKGPLGLFQHVAVGETGTRSIVTAINQAMPTDDRINPEIVEARFQKFWPDLQAELNSVPEPDEPVPDKRSTEDKISEMFEMIRGLAASASRVAIAPYRTFTTLRPSDGSPGSSGAPVWLGGTFTEVPWANVANNEHLHPMTKDEVERRLAEVEAQRNAKPPSTDQNSG